MATDRWTLLDESQATYADDRQIKFDQLGDDMEDCQILQQRLHGGLSDGVDLIRVKCGDVTLAVLPTRGMGIWKVWVGDEEIGWKSPNRGPVHPKFVPLTEPGGLGWLDGFDELLVRCGLESNGAPEFDASGRLKYPLHGRIANRPAHRVELAVDRAAGEISLTGVVEETRFHFTKLRLTSTVTLRRGEPRLWIRDEVENFSGSPVEMQLLYHINFGQPLLDPGARFVAPVRRVVPRDLRAAEGIHTWNRYAPPVAGYAEEVYLLELIGDESGATQTLLKNAGDDRGVSVHLNTRQLPCYTLWKNTTAEPDGYVTGLEPGTNFPNPRSFEGQRGRVVKLAPGATAAFDLSLEFHRDSAAVREAEETISGLRGLDKPEVFEQPQSDWCVIG
jgi:hypothetical protein